MHDRKKAFRVKGRKYLVIFSCFLYNYIFFLHETRVCEKKYSCAKSIRYLRSIRGPQKPGPPNNWAGRHSRGLSLNPPECIHSELSTRSRESPVGSWRVGRFAGGE